MLCVFLFGEFMKCEVCNRVLCQASEQGEKWKFSRHNDKGSKWWCKVCALADVEIVAELAIMDEMSNFKKCTAESIRRNVGN